MLLLTGARKREVLDAQWSDFDMNNMLWTIPIELDIKMGVAKKLVALDIKELDVNKIANITELPIKQIEKF